MTQTSAPRPAKPIATSHTAPLVIIKAIEPLTVSLDVGEALVAGMSMQVLARQCPDPNTRECLQKVGAQIAAAARAMCSTAAVDVVEVKPL